MHLLLAHYFADYDRVRSRLVDITNLLSMTNGAREGLTQHYVQEGWLDPTQTPTEYELVKLALQRIKIDPRQYDKFLSMLRVITGLDLIVKILSKGESENIFWACVK